MLFFVWDVNLRSHKSVENASRHYNNKSWPWTINPQRWDFYIQTASIHWTEPAPVSAKQQIHLSQWQIQEHQCKIIAKTHINWDNIGSWASLVTKFGYYADPQLAWVLAFISRPMEIRLLGVRNSYDSWHPFLRWFWHWSFGEVSILIYYKGRDTFPAINTSQLKYQ